jgi:hypothetical protein
MTLPGFSSQSQGVVARSKNALARTMKRLAGSGRNDARRSRLERLGTGLAATAATVGAYRYIVQPWHKTWGATAVEAQKSLPGDGLVPAPSYQTTRALTIDAPPEAVWPWLVQMGQGRGGFYSYDWLENLFGLDIHTADRIVPEWQDLEPGDTVRLAPPDQYEGRAKMRVIDLHENRSLVFGPVVDSAEDFEAAARTGAGTWAFVLEPLNHGKTRLLVRTRSRPWQAPRAAFYLYDPAHFLMERKMMLGIKRRAEATPKEHGAPPRQDGQQARKSAEMRP